MWMSHQPAHEDSPASTDGPSDLGSSSVDTESRKAGQQQPPADLEHVNASRAPIEATPASSASASASASALAPAATPTGHDEENKGAEVSEVGRGGSAVRGGERPPRPPGSIRQGRRDKRKAGWEAKKALAKEKKRAKRERR